MNNKIILKIPNSMIHHRLWISELILNRIYDSFEIIIEKRDNYEFLIENEKLNQKLIVKDVFFKHAEKNWLSSETLPNKPLKSLSKRLFEGKPLPILYGDGDFLIKNGSISYLNLDVFGSSYFMLSRYEELITKERDNHNRFPAYLSIAKQNGFLDRPLIDEYIIVLKKILLLVWPNLKFKKDNFKMFLSHDVDEPSRYGFKNNFRIFKSMVSDLVRKKTIKTLY